MSYIYKSKTGNGVSLDGSRMKAVVSVEEDAKLESFVTIDVLGRDEVIDSSVGALSTIESMRFIEFNTASGSALEMTGATLDTDCVFYGASISAGVVDDVVKYIPSGKAVVLVGGDVADGDRVVSGPSGVACPFLTSKVTLMSAVASTADDDFVNVWDSAGEVICIKTTTTVDTDYDQSVTALFIDDNGDFQTEVIYLDGNNGKGRFITIDPTTPVSGKLLCTNLVGYYVPVALAGTIAIQNSNGDVAVTKATPNGYYGKVVTASSDAFGQSVKVTVNGPITGLVVVVGTDFAGVDQYEVLSFNAEAVKDSSCGFAAVTGLLVGADGTATRSYTVEVSANTDSQVVAYASYGALEANATCLVELRSVATIGLDINGLPIAFPVTGSMATGDNATGWGIGSMGINVTTGKHYYANASGKWAE